MAPAKLSVSSRKTGLNTAMFAVFLSTFALNNLEHLKK